MEDAFILINAHPIPFRWYYSTLVAFSTYREDFGNTKLLIVHPRVGEKWRKSKILMNLSSHEEHYLNEI